MNRLYLRFFGRFHATLNEQPLKITAPKQQALLAWLALHPDDEQRRDALSGLLWPEHDAKRAGQNMRQLLTRLRKLIPDHIVITRTTIKLAPASDWGCDVNDFSRLYTAGDIEAAVALYADDFLMNTVVDSAEFEDWALLKREFFRREFTQALAYLTQAALAEKAYADAYQHAWQRTVTDQFDEAAHRDVMQALALDGRKQAAITHFTQLRTLLADELAVEPAAASVALYEQIIAGSLAATEQNSGVGSAAHRHNLPAQPTAFIGRGALLDRLEAQLKQPNCKLLTLLGMGGIGKTRLAIELSHRVLSYYPDGVWFVPLAAITQAADQDAIVEAIATALSINFPNSVRDGAARLQFIIGRIKQWHCLIVLDNYEQLVEQVEPVIALLQHVPEAQLVVTSREPLLLQAERLIDVDGLELAEATELFVTAARRVSADFQASPAIEKIVMQVACLPLAIELAATWVRQLSCAEIAKQISKDITFLQTQKSDMPQRHRSMRAVFNYSWRLLTDEQRALLRQLAIFPDDFSTAAVLAICNADAWRLGSLTAHSLVQRRDNGRFGFHPAVRQFSAEKLTDEHREVSRRFRQHYLNQMAAFASAPIEQTLPKVKTDFTNILHAWRLSAECADTELLMDAKPLLFRYFNRVGKRVEAVTLAQQTVKLLAGRGNDRLYGLLYSELASFSFGLAMFKEGLPYAEKANQAATACNDWHTVANTAYYQGELYWNGGEPDKAVDHYERALELSREHNIPRVEALVSIGLSNHFRFKGQYADALQASQRAVDLSAVVGQLTLKRTAYTSLGMAYEDSGDKQQALMYQEHALGSAQELGNQHTIAICHNNVAGLLGKAGRYAEAESHALAGIELCQQVDNRFIESILHYELASARSAQYQFDRAEPSFNIALERAIKANHTGRTALTEWTYAVMALRRGAWSLANTLLDAASARLSSMGPSLDLAETLCLRALAAWRLNDWPAAEQLVARAFAMNDNAIVLAFGTTVIGRIRLAQQQPEQAASAFEESTMLYDTVGAERSADEAASGWLAALQMQDAASDALHKRLLTRLQAGLVYDLFDPIDMFVNCLRVAFSAELHQQALTLLNETAAAIGDPLQRQTYLHAIPSHVALKKLAA